MDCKYFDAPFTHRKRIATHSGRINTLEFSPSAKFLVSGGDDGDLVFLSTCSKDLAEKERLGTPHSDGVVYTDYPREDLIYTAGADGQAGIFDLNRFCCTRAYKSGPSCTKISTCQSQNVIAVSTPNEILFYDENASFRPIYRFSVPESRVTFRPNTSEFLLSFGNYTLQMFDMRNFTKSITSYTDAPSCSKPKEQEVHSRNASVFKLIDLPTPSRDYSIGSGLGILVDCVFNEDGSQFLVTEHTKGPVLFRTDFRLKKGVFASPCMNNIVTFKSFRFGGPNDSYVLAGFDNKKVYYWKINQNGKTGERCRPVRGDMSQIGHYCDISSSLSGFNSIINVAVMHPQRPLIFCAGVENAIYAFSPLPLGPDDQIEPNYDTIRYTDAWLEEVYGVHPVG